MMTEPTLHYRLNHLVCTAIMLLALFMGKAIAADVSAQLFSYKDWDLTCDNTLTCRAAGYAAEGTEKGATVLLTREAGTGTPVINHVMLAHYDDEQQQENIPPDLVIGDHSLGALMFAGDEYWQMNETQAERFLTALKKGEPIAFRDNGQDYALSSAGSSAVLLKMDTIQGRVNTAGAILRKGKASEEGIRQPVPAPVIIQAPVKEKALRPMTPQELAMIKPKVLQVLNMDKDQSCMDEYQAGLWQIAQLSKTSSLVSFPCWFAAYNHGNAYFVISNDMATPPVMVTDSATDYDKGEISFSMKGRGLGDCWSSQSWVWNGDAFVTSAMNNTGRCMLIRPGGAWDIPEYVSQINPP